MNASKSLAVVFLGRVTGAALADAKVEERDAGAPKQKRGKTL
jgi:hypothetical protein